MKVINPVQNEIYLSEATQALINAGLTSSDKLIQQHPFGYTYLVETIFTSSGEQLNLDKQASQKYPLKFKEDLIFEFGSKGPRYFEIINDKLFLNHSNEVYDLSGNFIKRLDGLEGYSSSHLDLETNSFVLYNDAIYLLNEELSVTHKIDKISSHFSSGMPLLFKGGFFFMGFGNGGASCFIIKYNLENKQLEKFKLERGFTLVKTTQSGLLIAYHQTKGIYKIYDTSFALIHEFAGGKKMNRHAASSNGKYLAEASSDSTFLTLHDLVNHSSSRIIVHPVKDKAYKIKASDLGIAIQAFDFFNEDNSLFILGDHYRTIVYDLHQNSQTILKGHNGRTDDGFFKGVEAFVVAGDHYVTTSSDTTAIIWDRDFQIEGVLVGHNLGVFQAAYLPALNRMITNSVDGTIRFWSAY